jgi:hypothetical protein
VISNTFTCSFVSKICDEEQVKREMMIGYAVVYGWGKESIGGVEEGKKAFEKFAEELKEHKIQLLFWAGAYGAPEGMMFSAKFDDVKDWEKMLNSGAWAHCPLDRTRTNFGLDYTR